MGKINRTLVGFLVSLTLLLAISGCKGTDEFEDSIDVDESNSWIAVTGISVNPFNIVVALRDDGSIRTIDGDILNSGRQHEIVSVVAVQLGGKDKSTVALHSDGRLTAWTTPELKLILEDLTQVKAIYEIGFGISIVHSDNSMTVLSQAGTEYYAPFVDSIIKVGDGYFLTDKKELYAYGKNSSSESVITKRVDGVTDFSSNYVLLATGEVVTIYAPQLLVGNFSAHSDYVKIAAHINRADYIIALRENGTVVTLTKAGPSIETPEGLSDVVDIGVTFACYFALKSNGEVISWGSCDNEVEKSKILNSKTLSVNDADFNLDSSSTSSSSASSSLVASSTSATSTSSSSTGGANSSSVSSGTSTSSAGSSSSSGYSLPALEFGWSTPPEQPLQLLVQDTNQISAGFDYNLVLQEDSSIIAWGDNQKGQALSPSNLSDIVLLKSWPIKGYYDSKSYAIRANGSVAYWGAGVPKYSVEEMVFPKEVGVADFTIQGEKLVLYKDGTVSSWENDSLLVNISQEQMTGIVGIASTAKKISEGGFVSFLRGNGTIAVLSKESYPSLTNITDLEGIKAIAVGNTHGLALKADGTVVSWGDDQEGQSSIPLGLSNVVSISASGNHSLALKSDGSVVAWGSYSFTVFGEEIIEKVVVPDGVSNVVAISSAAEHDLALTADGGIFTWGVNPLSVTTPENLSGVKAIDGDLVLKKDGTVVSWHNDKLSIPADLNGAIAVSSWDGTNLVLKDDGTVLALGERPIISSIIEQGDDGDEPLNLARLANKPPSDLVGVVAISAAGNDAMALKSDGAVVVWGSSDCYKQQPADLNNIVSITSRTGHCLVVRADGTVAGWAAYAPKITPETVFDVTVAAVGFGHTLALKSDGTLITWDAWDEIPDSTISTVIPQNLSNVTAIAAGTNIYAALKEDETVVTWWSLGQESALSQEGELFDLIIPPADLKNVIAIDIYQERIMALKANGRVISWGAFSIPENFYDLLPKE